jgi:hypothetical protein
MENFVRSPAPSIEIAATVGGTERILVLSAVANPMTGETVGDTSLFEGGPTGSGRPDLSTRSPQEHHDPGHHLHGRKVQLPEGQRHRRLRPGTGLGPGEGPDDRGHVVPVHGVKVSAPLPGGPRPSA